MSRDDPGSGESGAAIGWLSAPPMLYPDAYVWFVFVSSLDIMLTWSILMRGGTELNPVASIVIDHWGLPGAIGFKFALMLFVIIACEIVGRSRPGRGRWLSRLAVAISAMPPVYSLLLLGQHHWLGL